MGKIAISKLRRDGGTQFRVNKHEDVIEEYAAAIRRGEQLPPVVAFYDGTDHWLADGFHTTDAHELTGAKEIEADIRAGTLRDAVLYAATEANRAHGIRFTNEEKRSRVRALLADQEWAGWTDREIARRCGVSNNMVSEMRRELSSDDNSATRKGKDGKQYPATKKGRKKGEKKPKAEPAGYVEIIEPHGGGTYRVRDGADAKAYTEGRLPPVPGSEGKRSTIFEPTGEPGDPATVVAEKPTHVDSSEADPDPGDDVPEVSRGPEPPAVDLSELNRSLAEEGEEFNLPAQRDRAYARFVTMFHEWPEHYHSHLIRAFERAKEEVRK